MSQTWLKFAKHERISLHEIVNMQHICSELLGKQRLVLSLGTIKYLRQWGVKRLSCHVSVCSCGGWLITDKTIPFATQSVSPLQIYTRDCIG